MSRSSSDDSHDHALVPIGFVVAAHGIRGEILVRTENPDSEVLGQLDEVYVGASKRRLRGARLTNKGWLLALEGVADRNAAEALRGQAVAAPRDELVEDDEVLLADLVGCRVVTTEGHAFGEVVAVELGMQDRLVVEDGEFERLIPVVEAWIADIDADAGEIVVRCEPDWPKSPRGARGDRDG